MKLIVFDFSKLNIDDLFQSSLLDSDDKYRISKIVSEKVRLENTVSTILKNKYIGNYYLNEHGKPLSDSLCFNIAHSHGLIVLGIDESPLGVDLEKIREYRSDLKSYISNEDEFKYINSDKSFFEIWTAKEALVKVDGSGINLNVKSIPALPLYGERKFRDKTYFCKHIEYKDFVISIARLGGKDYKIDIEELKIEDLL